MFNSDVIALLMIPSAMLPTYLQGLLVKASSAIWPDSREQEKKAMLSSQSISEPDASSDIEPMLQNLSHLSF